MNLPTGNADMVHAATPAASSAHFSAMAFRTVESCPYGRQRERARPVKRNPRREPYCLHPPHASSWPSDALGYLARNPGHLRVVDPVTTVTSQSLSRDLKKTATIASWSSHASEVSPNWKRQNRPTVMFSPNLAIFS